MNIYVGNLPFSLNEDELKNLFAQYGEVVSAKVMTDKFTGRSRGFGFVEMSNQEAGQSAIQALNGMEVKGRALRVDVARERQQRSYGSKAY